MMCRPIKWKAGWKKKDEIFVLGGRDSRSFFKSLSISFQNVAGCLVKESGENKAERYDPFPRDV